LNLAVRKRLRPLAGDRSERRIPAIVLTNPRSAFNMRAF
jgi:hypothetical protein